MERFCDKETGSHDCSLPPPTNGESTDVEEGERRMWQPPIPVKVKRRRGGASKLWLRASERAERGGEREAAHNVLTYV